MYKLVQNLYFNENITIFMHGSNVNYCFVEPTGKSSAVNSVYYLFLFLFIPPIFIIIINLKKTVSLHNFIFINLFLFFSTENIAVVNKKNLWLTCTRFYHWSANLKVYVHFYFYEINIYRKIMIKTWNFNS